MHHGHGYQLARTSSAFLSAAFSAFDLADEAFLYTGTSFSACLQTTSVEN